MRWAFRFWIRLLSFGSVTSVQSSNFSVLDLGDDEWCLELESRCLEETEGIVWVLGSLFAEVACVVRWRPGSRGGEAGDSVGVAARDG